MAVTTEVTVCVRVVVPLARTVTAKKVVLVGMEVLWHKSQWLADSSSRTDGSVETYTTGVVVATVSVAAGMFRRSLQ